MTLQQHWAQDLALVNVSDQQVVSLSRKLSDIICQRPSSYLELPYRNHANLALYQEKWKHGRLKMRVGMLSQR